MPRLRAELDLLREMASQCAARQRGLEEQTRCGEIRLSLGLGLTPTLSLTLTLNPKPKPKPNLYPKPKPNPNEA